MSAKRVAVGMGVALVAVCLFVFVPPLSAQGCPEFVAYLPGDFSAIAASGDHVYLGSGPFFLVVNVSDPSAPWGEGAFWIDGFPVAVEILDIGISAGYAYVTYYGDPGHPGGWVGVKVIDVSSPSAPFEVSDFPWGGMRPSSIDVEGGFAYVSNIPFPATIGPNRLFVFDVSDPLNPTEVGRSICGNGEGPAAVDVAVSGDYAFVADWYGLIVTDVSNPSVPIEVGFPATPNSAHAVVVSGDYAYVIQNPDGLWVLDVSNPTAPVDIGYAPTADSATDVAVSWPYAYVADSGSAGWSSLRVIDVSTPSAPLEVGSGSIGWMGEAHKVAVANGYVYMTTGGGMWIFRECAMFADGFETGDTTAWSSTVP